ncbi:MAG: hypothetical protein GQE15_27715 [Archangiaceae bacterium]|nr:hypothetical protein [Archangiaceae bacterium]
MPFEFLEPGVVRLTIPDTGWERSERAAFALAFTRSCASGPTGLILESNTRAVTEDGPNHMLDLFDQLRESITCVGVFTNSGILGLTVIAMRAAMGVRGIHSPLVSSADRGEVPRAVLEHTHARRQNLKETQPRGQA